jgi:hypothetical protein
MSCVPCIQCGGKLRTLLYSFFNWRWYRCEKCQRVARSAS